MRQALWKVPFDPGQAGESDAIALLQRWPLKVEVHHDGAQHLVQQYRGGQGCAPCALESAHARRSILSFHRRAGPISACVQLSCGLQLRHTIETPTKPCECHRNGAKHKQFATPRR